ncbi:MAG TPA: FAD-dependent oxidoreductase, partial [Solirubrobacteraceae bacterium]
AYFVGKLGVYVSSCDERRLGQWDDVSWKDFIREDQMSAEYRTVMSRSLVRNLAATKSSDASTHSIGLVGEASVMSLMGRGNDQDATFDRVLDGPTSEVWLDHWVAQLERLGVTFRVGWTVKRLAHERGRIAYARATDRRGAKHTIDADWFVCAAPLERTAALLNDAILTADPSLASIRRLRTDWMVGLVFYLRRPLALTHGHVNYVDSPWAITSISQAQFWGDLSRYGDGSVKESFSTIISDWETPGILYGKAARDCTPQEVAEETWAQIKAHLNDHEPGTLRDEDRHSWCLDPAMKPTAAGGLANDTPLFIQNPGSWRDRPESKTGIHNLFLAGDWVKTKINVTTMDGANQGGRTAANALLDAAGSNQPKAAVHGLYVPPEFELFKTLDRQRYKAGQPNMFDPDQAKP